MSDETSVASTEDAAAVLAEQMRIIDAAVREARRQGWCGEFEVTMSRLFPDGPPDGAQEFVDSDGLSCRGYDRDGFHRDSGYDRDGYDREGFRDGYDRDGWNREGFDRYGYDREGYNRDGYDRAGFNREGVRADGLRRDSDEYRARFRFDRFGYDRDGFNRAGRNASGLTREQVEEHGSSIFIYEWDEAHSMLMTADQVTTDGYADRGYGAHVGSPDRDLIRQLTSNRYLD